VAATAQTVEADIRALLDVKSPQESITYINELIYGDPGVGKTYYLGTCADHKEFSPFLLIDVEGGALTLHDRPDIDVVQVRGMKQVEKAINDLYRNPGYYKAAGLDSGTELQKLDMRTVMKEQYDKKPETTDIYVPSQREWGKSNERIRMIIRAFRDLPMHTFVTCLAIGQIDERSNKTTYMPSLPGKLKSEIAGFFDIVGYMRSKDERGEDGEIEIVRTLQVVKTDGVVAKDRTSKLGTVIRNPSVPMMWSMIQGESSQTQEGRNV
jgi:hypothetical protein